MTISTGTIARTIVLLLALVNQVLVQMGVSVIPIEDATIEAIITNGWTAIAAVVAWWKNNSFTQKAMAADATMTK